jgi:hypothetical protein
MIARRIISLHLLHLFHSSTPHGAHDPTYTERICELLEVLGVVMPIRALWCEVGSFSALHSTALHSTAQRSTAQHALFH